MSADPSRELVTVGRSWWEALDRRQFARVYRKRDIERRAEQRRQESFIAAHGITRERRPEPTTPDELGCTYWRQGRG